MPRRLKLVSPDGMDAPFSGVGCARMEMLLTHSKQKGTSMTEIMTIGLDLAKTVFQSLPRT